MGSSQSRNQDNTPPDTPIRGIRRRLDPLRRLSTLGRRTKRDRAQSSGTSTPKDKRSRIQAEDGGEEDGSDIHMSEGPEEERPPSWRSSPNHEFDVEHITTSARIPIEPAPSIHYPVGRATSPILSPIPLERLRSTSVPIWHSSARVIRRRSISIEPRFGESSSSNSSSTITPSSSTKPKPKSRMKRSKSDPAIGTPLIPLDPPDTPAAHIRRLGVEQDFLEGTVALLTEQLERSRRDMVLAEAEAVRAAERLRQFEEEQARLPGAVMMIQGIAQTQMRVAPPRRRLGRWRGREEEVNRRVPFEEQASAITGLISYVTYTYGIKLMDRVASLATANTLLSAERPRPRPNTVIETLMRRIQPTRPFAVDQLLGDPSISSSPSSSARSATTTTPALEPSTGTDNENEMGNLNMPIEFTAWLNTLQGSVREAIREFAEGTALPLSRTTSVQPATSTRSISRPDIARRISAPLPQPTLPLPESTDPSGEGGVPQYHAQVGQSSNPTQNGQNRSLGVTTDGDGNRRLNFFRAHVFAGNDEDPTANVPCIFVGVRSTSQDPSTFGQNGSPFTEDTPSSPNGGSEVDSTTPRPGQSRTQSLGGSVPGSTDVEPPTTTTRTRPAPLRAQSQTTRPSADNASLSSTGAQTGGTVPTPRPAYDPYRGIPSSPDGGPEVEPLTQPPRPAPSRTQSIRSRLLALSPFSRQQHPQHEGPAGYHLEAIPEPELPQATFIVYVIGGNYPRNHPVLRIPGLLTGEPLTDEEMTLIGELVGEVKPPTATAEEVEQSGLKVVQGSEIGGLVEKKEIIDSSAERCLVSSCYLLKIFWLTYRSA
jgi:hypothetical protein